MFQIEPDPNDSNQTEFKLNKILGQPEKFGRLELHHPDQTESE